MCAAMTSPRSPLERRSHWDTLRSLSLESVNLKNVADGNAAVDGRSTGGEQMQPGECVNIAVIGCGGWAQGWHLPHILNRNDTRVAALVDPMAQPGVEGCLPELCQQMVFLEKKYDTVWCKSIEEMLEMIEADELVVDGVIIAVPHHYHFDVGTKALKAGLHILMEKPLTADMKEAQALYELAMRHPEQAFIINNTANWQKGSREAFRSVASGSLGELRHVNCVFAAPLNWLFEGDHHGGWSRPHGTMQGNGFGWGQFSHTFSWVFKVTGLVPKTVYAVCRSSERTGADLFDAVTVTCTNGATISASGVGSCPDQGFKVISNWLFGTKGMLNYSGLAGSDNVKIDQAAGKTDVEGDGGRAHLEIWYNDGTYERGPPVEFEHLDQGGTGPGSLDALILACKGKPYYDGSSIVEGIKCVCTIEAMYRSAKSHRPEEVIIFPNFQNYNGNI